MPSGYTLIWHGIDDDFGASNGWIYSRDPIGDRVVVGQCREFDTRTVHVNTVAPNVWAQMSSWNKSDATSFEGFNQNLPCRFFTPPTIRWPEPKAASTRSEGGLRDRHRRSALDPVCLSV
ncbi:hypothetical protein [Nocardia transvalensis]|uniref:hypothetical protein n=1 Tax=Nocardia transvalensis TaxID=37333 RepID=UPI0018963606|nr:hypothetical protein [Nocardia transvalensis]MBF6330948.1 hypothetical protein [Nocardia transvalensis]